MARRCGASCGLLIFSAMVLRGLAVGNPPNVILLRALVGLLAGVTLGCLAACVARIVLAPSRSTLPDATSSAERRDVPDSPTRIVS